jgi:alanine racemase
VRSLLRVDAAAVRANVARLRAAHGGDLWAVVKADGYGHGAVDVGRAALEAGAIGLGVATIGEARALGAALPAARIMVLSPLAPGSEPAAAGLDVVCSTPGAVERLAAVPGVRLHLKADTGMGRWGLAPDEAIAAASVAGDRLGGLCSHLATSEERDTTFADEQIARFRALADRFPPCPRHLANSGGALYLAGARFDMARCGIALYGISPRDEDAAADGLTPVLTWTSEVRLVRALAPGDASGYGRRIRAERPLRVAHVPVGYADGFPRPAAGTAEVVVGGRSCTVGAVAMDQLAVILPDDLRVTEGDEVTLVGPGAPLEALARAAGTIGYEIACALRHRPDRGRREVAA